MDVARPQTTGGFAPLHVPNFRNFWIAGLLANSARWIQSITVPWVLNELTGSAFWVGLGAFGQMIPLALISPIAGSVSDRSSRHRILLVTHVLAALIGVAFAIAWGSGVRSPVVYVLISVASGSVAGMNLPSWQAIVSELVPRPLVMRAVTLNSAQFNAARAVGPMVAGVLLASLGPAWAFGINASVYAVVLFFLAKIRMEPKAPIDGPRPSVWADLASAVGVIRTLPGVQAALTVAMAIGFFGLSVIQMLVIFNEDVYELDEIWLGVMYTANAVGAITAAVVVSHLSQHHLRSTLSRTALGIYGLAIFVFATSPWPALGFAALFVLGACHLTNAAAMNTTVQLQVGDEWRGKVIALYLTALTISAPLGSLLLGGLIDLVGPRVTVAGAAVGMVLVWLALERAQLIVAIDDDGD